MNTLDVLENLEKLLDAWDISSNDWVLVSQYAYRLLGYKVKFRRGHFNILVRVKKIPWKIKERGEVHPPIKSKFRSDFNKFIGKTGFDFDINPASEKEFSEKKGKFEIVTLPNGKKIKVQKPSGAVKEFEKLLILSNDQGFGYERLDKDIFYIRDMISVLEAKKEIKTKKEFDKLLVRYLRARKEAVIRKNSKLMEVRGITGSPGIVSGLISLVLKPEDAGKIKKGNILVTPMTSPLLTSVLPRISAVITDKGGMLSHAAILAREIGIPCIVGTQNATKIFKSGDFVEVNADKGVIRKIK